MISEAGSHKHRGSSGKSGVFEPIPCMGMHVESTTGFACDFGGFGNLALVASD